MIDNAVGEAELTSKKIGQFSEEKEVLCGDISNFVADVNPMMKKLSALTNQVKELERYSMYLQMIGRVEDFR